METGKRILMIGLLLVTAGAFVTGCRCGGGAGGGRGGYGGYAICGDGTAPGRQVVNLTGGPRKRKVTVVKQKPRPLPTVVVEAPPVVVAPPPVVVERPPVVVAPPPPPPPVDTGPNVVKQYFPSGDCTNAAVLIEKTYPDEVTAGDEFEYTIRVINLTDCLVEEAVLVERLPSNFHWLGATPPPTGRTGDQVTWALGSLEPRAKKVIRVRGQARNSGTLEHCTQVACYTHLCNEIVVVQPRLNLAVTTPAQVLICDEIPIRAVVTNSGTGTARAVQVALALPPGLTAADGRQSVAFDAGDLQRGGSRELSFVAKATRVGRYNAAAAAKAVGGLTAEASSGVVVREPKLAMTMSARDQQYVGRPVVYDIVVANASDVPATDVAIATTVPSGTSFLKVSDGGQVSGDQVTWQAGTLQPGSRCKVTMTVRGDVIGTVQNAATASAYCASATAAEVRTKLLGIPAMLLEVVDEHDPVEVNTEGLYRITATNQGSVPATNVSIDCTFESNMTYVSSTGPTSGTGSQHAVRFAPVPSLAPGQAAEWRVVFRAVRAGDVRFKVQMNTDQLQRPVEETEATNLY